MNELFFIPAAIGLIFTIMLYNIRKVGSRLASSLIVLLCLLNMLLWPKFISATDWGRLGYGILAYIAAVCLLSSLLTFILQRQMNTLYMVILSANMLVFIISIIIVGISAPESSIIESVMFISSISAGINIIYGYFKKAIWRCDILRPYGV